jgi:hypothetical protein
LISPAAGCVILQLQIFGQLILSEVGQFSFDCCPLVQEISSTIHYLSCFGGGLSLCLFTGISTLGVYFFALSPFPGEGSVFHLPPPLSVLDYSSLFFSFVGKFGFVCCSLVQEISYLLCFREWLIAHLLSVFTAFPVFVY